MDFSPNIERLEDSATLRVSALAKRLRAEGREIIDLSVGEPDFATPAFICDRAIAAVRGGATRYTPAAGLPELRRAIARWLGRRAAREIAWEGVVVSCGAKHALFNACFALFGPGDEVLVLSPYWTSYPQIVTLARGEPVFVQGPSERGFRVTPDDLDRVATDRTRGLMLCSPCNPTGAVYGREELEAVARWAKERGVWLLSDEIYGRIYYGETERAPGILELSDDVLGPFVLVDGFSKSFAMTGWRLGFSYCAPELAARLAAIQSHVTSNPATPSQHAALAALEEEEQSDRTVDEMVRAFRRRRDLVVRLVREHLPDLEFVEPEGAFYLFFRVDPYFDDDCPDSTALCAEILERTGVALVPGAAFGDDRYARLSFAASDGELTRGIQRVADALSRRPARAGG